MAKKAALKSERGPYDQALNLANSGVPGSEVKAFRLLEEASKAGDYRATYAIGTWYLYGKVVRKNVRKALEFFRTAAENGIPEAAFDLAVSYETGVGIKQNESMAAAYYLLALKNGLPDGAIELHRMFYWGIGVTRNRKVAMVFEDWVRHDPLVSGKDR